MFLENCVWKRVFTGSGSPNSSSIIYKFSDSTKLQEGLKFFKASRFDENSSKVLSRTVCYTLFPM